MTAAQSAVAQAQAELDAAQVNFENSNRDLQRYQGLDERAKSQQQLDTATTTQKTAAAQVQQAKARLATSEAQVASAKASVIAADGDYQKAQADTARAKINLDYCRIVAPADGRVTNKNVDPGMYVTSSTQLFVLVPADVWVVANFKETQLDRMQPGQPVKIKVDAYPDREFHGTVQSIQAGTGSRFSVIPSENATGNFVKVVQRVPVKITFDGDVNSDESHLLFPGMSVEPIVQVQRRLVLSCNRIRVNYGDGPYGQQCRQTGRKPLGDRAGRFDGDVHGGARHEHRQRLAAPHRRQPRRRPG